MNNIKFSVIAPVYNMERYLEKCLESILNQTFRDFELICIDDCSTDKSLSILNRYAEQDKRIKVIALSKNKKQGGARNAGLDIARGKYVTFVDADDYINETLFEKMYNAIEGNSCDLVVTNIENIVVENNEAALELKQMYDTDYKNKELNTGFYEFEFYTCDIRLGPVAKLYKNEIIVQNKIRFPEGLINEDNAFYWCYMPFVKNLYFINETLYYRLVHPTSTMYRLNVKNENTYDQIYVIKYIYKFLKKYGFYKLYKNKFLDYAETILISKRDSTVRKTYFIKIAIFMPEIFSIILEEFKLLAQLIKHRKVKIAFWGASLFLEQFIEKYHIKFKNIIGIVDKDSKKWGNKIGKYEIFAPEKLEERGANLVLFSVKNKAQRIYPLVKSELEEKYPKIKLLENVFVKNI